MLRNFLIALAFCMMAMTVYLFITAVQVLDEVRFFTAGYTFLLGIIFALFSILEDRNEEIKRLKERDRLTQAIKKIGTDTPVTNFLKGGATKHW